VHPYKTLAAGILTALCSLTVSDAVPVDLTNNSDFSLKALAADYGGTALVGNFSTQPAGTGVFNPFLTVHVNGSGSVESGYNTPTAIPISI